MASSLSTIFTQAVRARLPSLSDGTALLAATCLLWLMFGYHRTTLHWQSSVSTMIFVIGGWLLRGVNLSGAFAGGAVALIFSTVGGWQLFAVLLAVFLLTLLATLSGKGTKLALGVAERSYGRRASQVMANLFIATLLVTLSYVTPADGLAMICAVAVLAEVAADTVSSEIGEAYGRTAFLITTMQSVTPGTNGGVSLIGTVAGAASAMIITLMAGWLGVVPMRIWAICSSAAIMGMFFDSLLGATLEEKGWLNNNAVNRLSTIFCAGFTAMLVVWLAAA